MDQAIGTVAARNKMSIDQLRQAIEKQGITWTSYRKSIRNEVLADAPAPTHGGCQPGRFRC